MKEHPILFSTSMVQAILAGKKKMTRRVIFPQPPKCIKYMDYHNGLFRAYMENGEPYDLPGSTDTLQIKYKYAIGDRLWVRETSYFETFNLWPEEIDSMGGWVYKADNPEYPVSPGKWRPSIFMPRKAARIFLTVTGLKGERVQDISEEDAMAEGVDPWPGMGKIAHVHSFYKLWEKINAKRGWGWDINPMTVAVSFDIDEAKNESA